MNVKFNNDIRLIISDVDETIADLFVPTPLETIQELSKLLSENKSIFLVSGSGFLSLKTRVADLFPLNLRKHILISHCSGAEIMGFDDQGEVLSTPYYSVYDESLTSEQKDKWREIVQQVITEFHLETHPPEPLKVFKEKYGDNPLVVMFEDRGPQITLEFVNSYNLSDDQINKLKENIPNFDMADLRIPFMERIGKLLEEALIPVTPRLGGMFALDLAIKGISKTTSVRFALENEQTRKALNIQEEDLNNPDYFEIWGDKFSVLTGTDRHMSEALPREVRSIDFRVENPDEFPEGYNIVVWDGKKHLHEGLLEYLQSRNQ